MNPNEYTILDGEDIQVAVNLDQCAAHVWWRLREDFHGPVDLDWEPTVYQTYQVRDDPVGIVTDWVDGLCG